LGYPRAFNSSSGPEGVGSLLVPSASRQRLPHLDGLRGIAAICVVLYHVHNLFGLALGFERAYLFVDVFFMLSGFVLTRTWGGDFA
jgi:peptidoglycan/LPS O-acetylase OafA/YrhL